MKITTIQQKISFKDDEMHGFNKMERPIWFFPHFHFILFTFENLTGRFCILSDKNRAINNQEKICEQKKNGEKCTLAFPALNHS